MLSDIAASAAHKIASLLIESGISLPADPVTRSVKLEDHRLQVVVTIAPYEPATISAETLAKIEAMKSPRLTPLMQKIVAALAGQPARKGTWIAAKIGNGGGGGFRSALADLVRMGVIVRGEGDYGYMLPALTAPTSRT